MPKTIKVGLDFAAPVPLHTDLSSPVFEGFEVDLMKEISTRLNFSLAYEVSLWKEILQKLQTGDIDVICSAATVTAERKNYLAFSDPYLTFKLAVVTSAAGDLIRPEQLRKLKIGVRVATEAEKYGEAMAGTNPLVRSDTNEELYKLLVEEKIDAVIDDAPIAFGFIKKDDRLKMGVLLPGTDAAYAIALKKSNGTLRESMNEVLRRLRVNGTYDNFYKKWFTGAQLV